MLEKKDSTKKTEQILQVGENIVLQEFCYYYRDGVLVTRKLGNVILTDKRFIILIALIERGNIESATAGMLAAT